MPTPLPSPEASLFRYRSELTVKVWENAVQVLGNLRLSFVKR